MEKITLNLKYSGIEQKEFETYGADLSDATEKMNQRYKGSLGWISVPSFWLPRVEEIVKIKDQISEQSDEVVVIGIGGSYLGAKTIIESLQPNEKKITIHFCGNNLSSASISAVINNLENRDFSIIVVSKSGSTIEPAISFRIFRKLLKDKYGESAHKRIFVITDSQKGILKEMADQFSYASLPIPSDIGGRYSVLTPAGLLPVALADINIEELLRGAADAQKHLSVTNVQENIAFQYAVTRNVLHKKGKLIEIFCNYEPRLSFLAEWWKQLFGESEGKDHKGLFPASANYTTDLHSLGQYVQDGPRHLFETIINIKEPIKNLIIPEDDTKDGLDFVEGKSLDFINKQAYLGAIKAHVDGGVPNIIFDVPKLTPYYIGYLIYT
ncbi:MAG TPA: glucose-6-phosphate isomerase, partial [Candidatus Omnitrophica bacterium]|nr:glucose-6-phosphate isomerase [Candidatus Omnitrophota bacterium]